MQLGGKGANLAEMSRIGLSVPPGLTITTDCCAAFHKSGTVRVTVVIMSYIRHYIYFALSNAKACNHSFPSCVMCCIGGKLPPGVWEEILAGLKDVEKMMDKKFGDASNPLLVSVRSGAAVCCFTLSEISHISISA